MRFGSSIVILLTLTAWHARADLVIVQKVEGMGQSGEMTLKTHGDSIRADVSPQISVIRDLKSGDSMTFLHEQKQFMRMSGAASAALAEQVKKQMPSGENAPAAKLQPTGRKEKIGGFDTEEYTAEAGAMKVRYWIAATYPGWADIRTELLKVQQKGLDQMMKGRTPGVTDFPGMPVRTEAEFNGQKLTTTILSVKSEPVEPAQFQAPPDYHEMTAPSFGGKPGAAPER